MFPFPPGGNCSGDGEPDLKCTGQWGRVTGSQKTAESCYLMVLCKGPALKLSENRFREARQIKTREKDYVPMMLFYGKSCKLPARLRDSCKLSGMVIIVLPACRARCSTCTGSLEKTDNRNPKADLLVGWRAAYARNGPQQIRTLVSDASESTVPPLITKIFNDRQ